MAQRIGQAYGGDRADSPGDGSGGEVRLQTWYSYARGWNCVLRAKDSAVAERMAAFCEAACANDHIGYSQARRNTLRDAAKKAGWDASQITDPCDCDCSSLMAVCAEAAGVDMSGAYTSGNAPWTGNMAQRFAGTGAFRVLTDSKYLSGPEHLCRGDILVNAAYHTLMVLDDGAEARPEGFKVGDVLCYVPGGGVHFAPSDGAEPTCFREFPGPVYPARVVMTAPDTPRPYLVLMEAQTVCGWVAAESLARRVVHTVAAGDSMWGIARKYGTTMEAIRAANGMKSVFDPIHPGDTLRIPAD